MIDGSAECARSTDIATAWIDAAIFFASFIARAIGAENTFGLTSESSSGIAFESRETIANVIIANFLANGVGSAGGRMARIAIHFRGFLARFEGISDGGIRTRANGHVIGDGADCADAAGSWARIFALVPDAGAIIRTIGIDETLRMATFVRISSIIGQTFAESGILSFSAVSIDAAGRRAAGSGRLNRFRSCK